MTIDLTLPNGADRWLVGGDVVIRPNMSYEALIRAGYMPPNMIPWGEPLTQDAADMLEYAKQKDAESRAMKCQYCGVLIDAHTRAPDGLVCHFTDVFKLEKDEHGDGSCVTEYVQPVSLDGLIANRPWPTAWITRREAEETFPRAVWTCENHPPACPVPDIPKGEACPVCNNGEPV